MRFLQIIFFLGLPLFILTSGFNSANEKISGTAGIPEKFNIHLASDGLASDCSICHSGLSRYDLCRKPCEHGFHVHCLQSAFANKEDIEIFKNCRECGTSTSYIALLAHLIFVSPVLPDGITYIPNYLTDINITKIWVKAMGLPHSEALKRLIKIGMPVDIMNIHGKIFDMIILAGSKATPVNLVLLLDSGLKLCTNENQILIKGFVSSIATGNLANAAIFLKRGVNINAIQVDGSQSALSTAIETGKLESIKFLIDNNADLNPAGPIDGSPLHWAVKKDNAAIVELLMRSKKVDINAVNNQRRTAVQSAACLGKLNALGALLDNGAPSNVFTSEGYSLLQYAIAAGTLGSVKFLIERGFLPLDKNGQASYVLHLAISLKKSETVKYLLNHGASPYSHMPVPVLVHFQKTFPQYAQKITQKDPPIAIAILAGDIEVFKALLEAGTNPNTRIFNSTCSLLHLVCQLGNVQMAAHLIELGADFLAVDSDGRPSFWYNDQDFFNAVFYNK